MSQRLRELIRQVRACKTAAEERAIIANESSLIRTAFKARDDPYRHRNLCKLLYMHMMGYPAHFGQMECIKMIAGPGYAEKRLGYLGLMMLLDEKAKVLMLVTNSIKSDFGSKNPYIVGLALTAMGNICSPDMARDLASEVARLFKSPNAYLRKKACLCATRVVRKVSDMVEEFNPGVMDLLQDKNHAVLLGAVTLMLEMVNADPAIIHEFRKHTAHIVRMLENLLVAGHISEYEIGGLIDPFLQAKILRFLGCIGADNDSDTQKLNEILTQVCISTEPKSQAGNAILYEAVNTIFKINTDAGLRVLAVNILGRFLSNREHNIRYVALNVLCRAVDRDQHAIQRYRDIILDCLKDPDISIRRRALDLIHSLVTPQNMQQLLKDLMASLHTASSNNDHEFVQDLTDQICTIIQDHSPSPVFHVEKMIELLQAAGANIKELHLALLMSIVQRGMAALQAYASYKLYFAMRDVQVQQLSQSMMRIGIWCIGEYVDRLIHPAGLSKAKEAAPTDKSTADWTHADEHSIVLIAERILLSPGADQATKQYAITAVIKLLNRLPNSADTLKKLLLKFESSMSVELQQRASEYMHLADASSIRPDILDRMPPPAVRSLTSPKLNAAVDDDSEESTENAVVGVTNHSAANEFAKKHESANLFDLDLLGENGRNSSDSTRPAASSTRSSFGEKTSTMPALPEQKQVDLLGDIFSSSLPSNVGAPLSTQSINSVGAKSSPGQISDLLDMSDHIAAQHSDSTLVFQSKRLQVHFHYEQNQATPNVMTVTAYFSNNGAAPFTGFDFQVAVPKHVQLEMRQATSNTIPAHSSQQVKQSLKLTNTLHGEKKLMIRCKIIYMVGNEQVQELTQIDKFPS